MKTKPIMKPGKAILRIFPALVLLMIFLTGCATARQGAVAEAGRPGTPELSDRKAKLSYALGMDYGTRLRDRAVEVDPDLFSRGLLDARSGKETLLTEAEARAAVLELQAELANGPAAPPADLNTIQVSFMLDPRLTRGMYMGDRWVSPPTYTRVGQGREVTVEARAEVLDARGMKMKNGPEWIAADPEMVTVSPGQGNEVTITVKRPGESVLKVVSGEVTRELLIRATEKDQVLRVDISQ